MLNFASRTGFDGIELVSDWPMGGYPSAGEPDRIRALRRLYDGYGLRNLMNGSTGRPHELLERVGVSNIPTSLRLMRDGGFRGWIMIDAWEIPDPYDACRKGYRAIMEAKS